MLRFGFSRKEPRDRDRIEALQAAVRAALGLGDDTVVSINEITCPDPACPVAETIVLVMEPGKKTRAHKIHGGLDGLEPAQLADLLARSPSG